MAKGLALFKYLNLPVFFISFLIGMVGVFLTDPFKRKVYIYPSPDNIESIQYTDKTGACFEYEQQVVQCPSEKNATTKIRPQV